MENSTVVLKAVISGNAEQLNEVLQSLNSTERVSVLAAQDYTDKALEEKHVIRIPCKTTPLIVAVQTGNLDCVKVLLNYKADIEEQGESFRYLVFPPDDMWNVSKFESAYTCPPLFLAAANGNLDILSYLFEQGANVNASSSANFSWLPRYNLHWYTPLIIALRNGHIDAFTFLIDKGADVNLQDHQGYTALHHAVETKNFDAISCLVYNGADVNLFTSSKCTPLMLACQSDNMDAINFLLNKGADVNLQGHQGYTALHHAVARKNFSALSCLVHNGADVNLFTSCKQTPLMLACQSHNMKAINFLLNKGADVNLQDQDGYTALHYAVKRKNFDAVSCLVDNRADVNLFTSSKQTPLMMACQSHDMEIINFLGINKGTDVNLQDRDGQSALHFASLDSCYWLIQNLADVNMCDNHNCTPLMLASRNTDVKKVAMLIENGAKVDLQDVDGNTALHHAVLNSYDSLGFERTPDICLALLTAKASIHLCNSQGWTPLLLASTNCIESVVEILLKQPGVTKEQRANALELLGASTCLMDGFFSYIEEGFSYIKGGMTERFADASHPLLKQQVEPAEAYQNRRECQTLEELAEIQFDGVAIIMESLVIRERIIGANNVELLKPIEHVAGHFYSKDPGHFKRLIIPLYRYAAKIAQGCIEECFESAVSCLWHLTYALYGCEQYFGRELLLELLELAVFLCENWRDSKVYQSVWDIEYDDEEVSLFDSVEMVIYMITKSLQDDEEDETYSNVLVLLRKLLRYNPRCRNYNGTLLHVRTYSTEEIIVDIVPSADTVKLLLNAGFNANATDCDGDTPLHRAASLEPGDDLIHQVPEIMKALFYGGAHHDFVNNDGKTPMDMAKTDEARMILSAAERRKLELKCISARAVKKFGIPYLGEVPKTLEKYISMH